MTLQAPISIQPLAEIFEVPLRNLGELDSRLEGILCPVPELGAEKVGITNQFLSEAETHHTRYSDSDHFSRLFQQAFAEADVSMQPNMNILDIGAGSGANTIQPALSLFQGRRIVATDLSPAYREFCSIT